MDGSETGQPQRVICRRRREIPRSFSGFRLSVTVVDTFCRCYYWVSHPRKIQEQTSKKNNKQKGLNGTRKSPKEEQRSGVDRCVKHRLQLQFGAFQTLGAGGSWESAARNKMDHEVFGTVVAHQARKIISLALPLQSPAHHPVGAIRLGGKSGILHTQHNTCSFLILRNGLHFHHFHHSHSPVTSPCYCALTVTSAGQASDEPTPFSRKKMVGTARVGLVQTGRG